jgi:hypothetical protein
LAIETAKKWIEVGELGLVLRADELGEAGGGNLKISGLARFLASHVIY